MMHKNLIGIPNANAKSEFLIPIEKGKYKVHGLIGEGAVGKILLASILPFTEQYDGPNQQYELVDSNVVILKLIELTSQGTSRAFQQEVYFLQLLKHPNILESREAYTFIHGKRNTKFGVMVTEKMDVDLMDYVLENGSLSENEAKSVFRDICLAVDYCHSRNVAHLDIKPDNVLLSIETQEENDVMINPYQNEDGESDSSHKPKILRAKLCDFGFAAEWNNTEEIPSKIGTKEYRAPEAFFANKKTLSTKQIQLDKLDIWALGVTLFVLLTTCFPFAFHKRHTTCFRLPLSYVNNYSNDQSCTQLLKQMLKKNPKKRPSITQILSHPWLA